MRYIYTFILYIISVYVIYNSFGGAEMVFRLTFGYVLILISNIIYDIVSYFKDDKNK